MPRNKRQKAPAEADPQPISLESSQQGQFDPTPLLARIDTLERGQKLLTDTISFVKDTNYVVLIVLALGFIALLTSFIAGIIQSFNNSSTTQQEFIKSVQELKNEIIILRSDLPQTGVSRTLVSTQSSTSK
jgi:hypothetical protein